MAKKKAKRKSVKKPVKRKTAKKKTPSRKKPTMALAIIALILNVLVLPGFGSLIGGKTKAGIWQLVLAVLGIILSMVLVGIPLLLAAWIWGIVTGIQLIQRAQ